jgi:uncharacterized protein (DUF4415 family)
MKKSITSKQSQTDWERLNSLKDEEIDFSDIPEIPPEVFAQAVLRQGLIPARRKEQLTIRVDSDVLTWFKAQGRGYHTRINSLLRAYMEAHTRPRQ